jgi:hypothetical protein
MKGDYMKKVYDLEDLKSMIREAFNNNTQVNQQWLLKYNRVILDLMYRNKIDEYGINKIIEEERSKIDE